MVTLPELLWTIIMQLHHLAIGATEVDRLATFYKKAFNLNERSRQSDVNGLRSVWLELGEGVLMIEKVDESQSWEGEMRRGIFLIAFRVSDESRKAVEEGIIKAGGFIDFSSEFTTYARDPENNRVAISSHSLCLDR